MIKFLSAIDSKWGPQQGTLLTAARQTQESAVSTDCTPSYVRIRVYLQLEKEIWKACIAIMGLKIARCHADLNTNFENLVLPLWVQSHLRLAFWSTRLAMKASTPMRTRAQKARLVTTWTISVEVLDFHEYFNANWNKTFDSQHCDYEFTASWNFNFEGHALA